MVFFHIFYQSPCNALFCFGSFSWLYNCHWWYPKLHASLFPSVESRVTFHVTFLRTNNIPHSYPQTLLASHWPDLGHMPILKSIIGQDDGIPLRPSRFPFPKLKGETASPEELVLQEGEVEIRKHSGSVRKPEGREVC